MEFFKQWAISICACGIIGTVFSMIAPKGSMEKILHLVIAVFIFTSVLLPFLKMGDVNLSFDEANFSSEQSLDELVERSNEITLSTSKVSVEKAVSEFLVSNNFSDAKVKAKIDSDENNNIIVNSIEIGLPSEVIAQSENVTNLVQNKFEIETRVISSEDFIYE